MRVWIRADGNGKIASGHLRRTLSIAQVLRRRGCEVQFLLADDESRNCFLEITDRNREKWSWLELGLPYGAPMAEIPVLRQLAASGKPDWLLVDSYAVTEEFFPALGEGLRDVTREDPESARTLRAGSAGTRPDGSAGVRLAYLDDLQRFDPDVDLVINYAPGQECACTGPREEGDVPVRDGRTSSAPAAPGFYRKAPVRLLGPSYAPLRRQFSQLEPAVRETVSRVLITTGGSDPFQMASALESMVQEEGLEAAVIAPGRPCVENMAALMQSCDLCVSAGGTTLYELCAAGVPTLCWTMADNQVRFAGAMAAAGACTPAGDVREPSGREKVLRRVLPWIRARADAKTGAALRGKESAAMHALTDGLGAERIAQALMRG